MNTVLDLLDLLVLVSIVIHLLRRVWAGMAKAAGAWILMVCLALLAAFFATVSFTVYMALVNTASSSMHAVLFAFLVLLALILWMSATSKQTAQEEQIHSDTVQLRK